MSSKDDQFAIAMRKASSAIVSLTRAMASLNSLHSPGHPMAALIRAMCTSAYGLQQTFALHRDLMQAAEKPDDGNVPLPFAFSEIRPTRSQSPP